MKINLRNAFIDCPYCGHEHEFNFDIGAIHAEDTQCQKCNKKFCIEIHATYYVSVKRIYTKEPQ